MSSAPLRAFIAIEIPEAILDRIASHTADLRRSLGDEIIRWVPTNNIHLTLKFLGDISSANVDILAQVLTAETRQIRPFTIQISRLGVFPDLRRPRVIWIGVESPPALKMLQHGLETSAERLGYAAEDRPFSPHLTIGRIRQRTSTQQNQRIRDILSDVKIGELGSAQVDVIHIFKSDLKPGGAVYTRLHSAYLDRSDAS